MKILAIDTATEACSVAIYHDAEIIENYLVAPQQHSQLILPMIQEILAGAELNLSQLDALAFGRGPGSFTGVRIAASVIQGIAFAVDLPVVPISTLQAIAQGTRREFQADAVLAVIDARMNEVYWGQYRQDASGIMQLRGTEAVISPAEITLAKYSRWVGAGSGWFAYDGLMQQRFSSALDAVYEYYPHAYDIAYLASAAYQQGQYVNAEEAIPVYLRDNVAIPKC